MSVREIRVMGDPVLRREAAEVGDFGPALRALVRDMFETMYHAEGIGLAAPQIGVSTRVFVIDVGGSDDEPGGRYALVNPLIVELSKDTERLSEGCLSIPGLEDVVERPASVVLQAVDPEGDPVRIEATGLLSRALQHELDHLDGILFPDRVTPLKRRLLLKKWKKLRAEEAAS